MTRSNLNVIQRDFEQIKPLFTDSACNELHMFLRLGLLSSSEQAEIYANWDHYESLGWFEDEVNSDWFPEYRASLHRLLLEQGWGVKGNFFTELATAQYPVMIFREWFSENLILSPTDDSVWGEEIGFYEFEGFCVAKSVIDNHHFVWDFNSPENKSLPYISGGLEVTMKNPQITTKNDIKERFGVELLYDMVIYSR